MNKYAMFSHAKSARRGIFRRVHGSAKMCMAKTGFETAEKAKQRADEITAQGTAMRFYQCPHCTQYHLSRVKEAGPQPC